MGVDTPSKELTHEIDDAAQIEEKKKGEEEEEEKDVSCCAWTFSNWKLLVFFGYFLLILLITEIYLSASGRRDE